MLQIRCRNQALMVDVFAKFGGNLSKHWPMRVNQLASCEPIRAKIDTISVHKFGRVWPKLGQVLPKVGHASHMQCCPPTVDPWNGASMARKCELERHRNWKATAAMAEPTLKPSLRHGDARAGHPSQQPHTGGTYGVHPTELPQQG